MRARLLATIASAVLVANAASPAGAQDHAAHGQANPAPAQPPVPASDPATTDHGKMDHGTMDHGQMDHGAMDHGTTEQEAVDQGAKDHGAMDHAMHGMGQPTISDQPGTAPAPAPPKDHAADAIFGEAPMAASRDRMRREMKFATLVVGLDQLEYRAGKGDDGFMFDGEAWYGGDIDRVVLAYSGEGTFGESPEEIELDAYWRHAINPWFNLQLGARHDFRPDPERSYALLGIEGIAPYWIEVEAQAFVSEKGDVHLRASAMHDMRLTQRLVFESELEIDAALQSVPELGIGKGIEKIELAGRLRYEIERNFAPYLGVAWERKVGQSADFARDEGEDASRLSFLAGLRFWF